MARGKSRLQLHHTINVSAPRKFAMLSKTSTRIRKVLTSTSAPSPNITGTEDNPDELPTVPTFDFEPELNPTIIDYPAGLHVKPKAKRYQNSVCFLSVYFGKVVLTCYRMPHYLPGGSIDKNIWIWF